MKVASGVDGSTACPTGVEETYAEVSRNHRLDRQHRGGGCLGSNLHERLLGRSRNLHLIHLLRKDPTRSPGHHRQDPTLLEHLQVLSCETNC